MTLSDLYTRITNLARTSGTALRAARKQVGKLTDLTTDDKSSIVNAINELNAKFSSNSSGSERLEAPIADVLNTLDKERLEAVLKFVESQIDSDEDGVNDYEERHIYKTNPHKTDTDEDGYSDYDEIHGYETDPNDRESIPDLSVNGFEIDYEVYNGLGIIPTKDGSRLYSRPSDLKVEAFILTSSGTEDPLVVRNSHGLVLTGYTVLFEGYSILEGFRFIVRVSQESGYSETKVFVAIKRAFESGYAVIEENMNSPDITHKIATALRDKYRQQGEFYDSRTDSTSVEIRIIPFTYEIPFLSDNFEFIYSSHDGTDKTLLKISGEPVRVPLRTLRGTVSVKNKVTGEEILSGLPHV